MDSCFSFILPYPLETKLRKKYFHDYAMQVWAYKNERLFTNLRMRVALHYFFSLPSFATYSIKLCTQSILQLLKLSKMKNKSFVEFCFENRLDL